MQHFLEVVNKIFRIAKRLGLLLLITWTSATCAMMFAVALVPEWPSRWELPWSGYTDFAVLPNEVILVYICDFDRVLKYSVNGAFLGSIPAAGYQAGRGRIATTADGRIVLEHMERVLVMSSSGEVLSRSSATDRDLAWRLSPDGEVIQQGYASKESQRPAMDGELLLGGFGTKPRKEFRVGGIVVKKAKRCLSITAEGKPLRMICSPWYLWPITMWWPAAAPIFLGVLLGQLVESRRRRTERSKDPRIQGAHVALTT